VQHNEPDHFGDLAFDGGESPLIDAGPPPTELFEAFGRLDDLRSAEAALGTLRMRDHESMS
jgi:hypothetical protein